ncbi:MAG TPA: hypothetical protein DFS52_13345 [Myxococcales bacterium]|nr:hypothetical protein [Myxococcales bacterium]
MWKVVALLLSLCFIGCSDPYAQKLPASIDGLEKDEALKKAIQKLPEQEKALLGQFLLRRGLAQAFGGGGAEEVTVRQAIDRQRRWLEEQAKQEAEAKALADRVKAEREAKRKEFAETLTVAVTSLQFVKGSFASRRFDDRFQITLAFQNKTARAFAGVKGTLVFADMFGTAIKQISIAYDQGIEAGSTATWAGEVDFNQFIDDDKKLASTPLDKLKTSWLPEHYIFSDGTAMKMPD